LPAAGGGAGDVARGAAGGAVRRVGAERGAPAWEAGARGGGAGARPFPFPDWPPDWPPGWPPPE